MKVRSKRIANAVQWKGFNGDQHGLDVIPMCAGADNGMFYPDETASEIPISPGDWVVRTESTVEVVKEADFAAQYEEIL